MTKLLIKMFIKNHTNTSNTKVREQYGKLAGILGILTNLLLFFIKIIVGAIGNSIAIIADAFNNLTDSASSAITLIGFKLSGKPADNEHPYGHARMEYVTSLIVSLTILFLGFQLINSAIGKIINPQKGQFSTLSFIILIISILIKLWQFIMYQNIGRIIDSKALITTSVDSRNDILATAAILAAAIVSNITGFYLDGYIGFCIALFIIISGIRLIIETISPLLGIAPTKELVDSIYKKILSYDSIIGLHDLTVHNYGEGKCFASVHCEVSAEQDIMVSHDIIDNIERDFLKNDGIHLVIHLDPVVKSDERTNKLKARVEGIISNISKEISFHDFRVVWGVSHSNLIFDVVVPFDFEMSDEELINLISSEISKLDSTYNAVVLVDHSYIPENSR